MARVSKLWLLGAASFVVCWAGSDLPLYKQAGAPIPARVADLISRMTPLELVGQLQNKNEGGWDQIPNSEMDIGRGLPIAEARGH